MKQLIAAVPKSDLMLMRELEIRCADLLAQSLLAQ